MNYFDVKNKEVYICFGSGQKYKWQYGGMSCSQGEIKNPTLLGTSNARIFDSSFWYSLSHFEGFVIPKFSWKMSFGSNQFDKEWQADLERANQSKNKITFESLFGEVIREAGMINKKFTDFQLTLQSPTDRNEAFVPVSFLYQHKRKRGILIWQNCD